MSVYIFISIKNCPPFPVRPDLSAFVQKHIEIVRMEYPLPKTCPVVTDPDVEALVIPERTHEPLG